MKHLLVFVPLLVLTACPPPRDKGDGGVDSGFQPPQVSSITPTSGPVAGGTAVQLFGSNFEEGVKVFFGGNEATPVTRVTRSRLTTTTPAGSTAGAVDVKVVSSDGQESVLAGGFTYEAPPARTIANAFVENPPATTVTNANASVQVAVIGVVTVALVTDGVGAGAGVLAQVGHAPDGANPADQSAFTWAPAAYVDDTGPALENDRYSGNVTVSGPVGAAPVTYVLAARFSVDNGTTWVLADRDGSSNGPQADQLPKLTVGKPTPNWCKLGGVAFGAEATSLRTNQPNGTFYAQVYQQGVTEAAGAGAGISAQLGYGAPNTLTDGGTIDDTKFTWTDATFNVDQGNNDEWQAVVATPAVGTYKYAYRVRLNGGPYLYCDADGPDVGGFTEDQLGTLTVAPVQIDSCKLQFPPSMVVPPGATTYDIFGRVTAAGVTDVGSTTTAPANLTAEVGYGLATTPEASWTWTAAAFNTDLSGTDEFKASFAAPATPGSYRYAYRFRYGTTGAYTYCDLDGSTTGGFTVAQAGRLEVPSVSDCRLSAVPAATVSSGSPLLLKARVFGQGVTTTAGANSTVKVQLGLGDPNTSAAFSNLWGWGDAAFAADISTAPDNGWDEYSLTATPAYGGGRGVAARVSTDNGQSWLYCDLNAFSTRGFEQAEQGNINVTSTTGPGFCNTQFPATVTQGTATTVFGKVYQQFVTEAPGAGAGIVAELGYGPTVEDPGISSAWAWINGAFNVQVGNDDEWKATLPASAPLGTSYAFRFSHLGGPYCFGDLDGNGASGSFSGESPSGAPNTGRVVP